MKKLFLLSIICGLSAFCLYAQNVPFKIDVTDDVYVYGDSGDKDTSKGTEDKLRSYFNDGTTAREMVFLKFDISTLSTIEVEQIKSIKLKMYGAAQDGGGNSTPTTHTLKVFNMTAANSSFSWTENTMTYNAWFGNGVNSSTVGEGNSGQSDAYFYRRNPDVTSSNNNGNPDLCIATLSDIGVYEGWFEWDITSSILSHSGSEISLQICDNHNVRLPNSTNRSYVTFHSKENVSGNTPCLEVTFKEDTRILTASADTYLNNNSTPNGVATTLQSYYNDNNAYRRMIFLKFVLDIPYDLSLINSATLKMYGTADLGGGSSTSSTHTMDVFDMTAYANEKSTGDFDWDESTFSYDTWDNSAYKTSSRNPDNEYSGIGDPKYRVGRLENVSGGEKWFEWDITTSIFENMGNTMTLQVCDKDQIKTPSSQNSLVTFHSKENTSGNAPQIEFGMKKSDFLLGGIQIEGVEIANFDSYITSYTKKIPVNSVSVPQVTCNLVNSDENIKIDIQHATTIDGTTIITISNVLNKRDGDTELVYKVSFDPTDLPTSIDTDYTHVVGLNVIGKALDITNVQSGTSLFVTDLSGKVLVNSVINDNYSYTFDMSGVYIISLSNNQQAVNKKVIIK